MTKAELTRQILSVLYESSYNEDVNLFNNLVKTFDFYFQCELRNLREQESDLDKEQVLTLIEQALILGELRGKLESEK